MKKINFLLIIAVLFMGVGCSSSDKLAQEDKSFKEGNINDIAVIANTKWTLNYAYKQSEEGVTKDDSIKAGSVTLELTDNKFTLKDTQEIYEGIIEIDKEVNACFLVAKETEFMIQFNSNNQLTLSDDGTWGYTFDYIK